MALIGGTGLIGGFFAITPQAAGGKLTDGRI